MAPAPAPIRLRPTQDESIPETFRRKKRGLIYVRVSVARADMISPELQVGHAQKLADANDIEVILDPIMDLGESGREFEERAIGQIKEMARNKEFDVLILWIWSRFGRNLKESLQHLDDLLAYGIEVRAAHEDFDGKTTIGRFAIAQMLNIAELESNQKSDMWKAAIERRKNRGLPHGAAARGKFGYYRCDTCPPPEPGKPMDKCPKCKEGILKIDPLTGPILAKLYLDYVAGVSVRSMVLWLRRKKIVNWTGREIDAGDLYSILDSGFGLGFVRYTLPEELYVVITREDGTTKTKRKSAHRDITAYLYYRGKHQAVFEDEVECERIWDAYVERRLKGRDNDDKGHSHAAKYQVSGVLTCSGCGLAMHSMLRAKKVQKPWVDGKPHPGDVLFRCTRHMKFQDCPGGGVYVTLETAEQAALAFLTREIADDPAGAESLPVRMAEVQAKESPEISVELKRLDEIKVALAAIRQKEDRLTDAVVDELISQEAARRKRAEYDTQKSALREESAELEKKIKERPQVIARPEAAAVASAMEVYEVAEPGDQRLILRALIREIRVNRGRNPETKCKVWPLWVAPPPKPELATKELEVAA
ncbi:recombinase family protein [Streptomyces olivoreticuli]|uniref:recombinase family protein n=1 Tax=Streptomyces olivoreticuli TaxID=68246 RepID=UPI00265B46F8|nr:recombinase family protein [Streptomyces olivoreticuli]WKK27684.1 recombinase family protein [Streptomyces olivoreticuli]